MIIKQDVRPKKMIWVTFRKEGIHCYPLKYSMMIETLSLSNSSVGWKSYIKAHLN